MFKKFTKYISIKARYWTLKIENIL